MARPHQAQAAPQPAEKSPPAKKPTSGLKVAGPPPKRFSQRLGFRELMWMGLGLFVMLAAVAVLHVESAQNQASLDDQLELNRLHEARVEELMATLAHLDSPEGLTEQATAAGLVAAAELVTLTPILPGTLLPPPPDAFRIAGLPPLANQSPASEPPASEPPADDLNSAEMITTARAEMDDP